MGMGLVLLGAVYVPHLILWIRLQWFAPRRYHYYYADSPVGFGRPGPLESGSLWSIVFRPVSPIVSVLALLMFAAGLGIYIRATLLDRGRPEPGALAEGSDPSAEA